MSIDPTNNKVTFDMMDIIHIKTGKWLNIGKAVTAAPASIIISPIT